MHRKAAFPVERADIAKTDTSKLKKLSHCVCGNGHDVAENSYNRVITNNATCGVNFCKKKNHIRDIWTYNCIFIVKLLLLCNNMPIAIIIALYKVLLVDNLIFPPIH